MSKQINYRDLAYETANRGGDVGAMIDVAVQAQQALDAMTQKAEDATMALLDSNKRTKELTEALSELSNNEDDIEAPYTSLSVIEGLGRRYIAEAMSRRDEDLAEATWRVWQYMISSDDARGKRLWIDNMVKGHALHEQQVALMQRAVAADERIAAAVEEIAAALQSRR